MNPSQWPEVQELADLKKRIAEMYTRQKSARLEAFSMTQDAPNEELARRRADLRKKQVELELGEGSLEDVARAFEAVKAAEALPSRRERASHDHSVVEQVITRLTKQLKEKSASLRARAATHLGPQVVLVLEAYAVFIDALDKFDQARASLGEVIGRRHVPFSEIEGVLFRTSTGRTPAWAMFSNPHGGWGAYAEEVQRLGIGEKVFLSRLRQQEADERERWRHSAEVNKARRKKLQSNYPRTRKAREAPRAGS